MEEYLKHMAMAYILSKTANAESYPYASIDFQNGIHINNARACADSLGREYTVLPHSEQFDEFSFRYMGVKFFSLELKEI